MNMNLENNDNDNMIMMRVIRQFLSRENDTNIWKIDYLKLLAHLDDNDTKNNEISLYAMCMMSNSTDNLLKWNENVKLLNLFLGHAGVYDNCATRKRMFSRYNLPTNGFYSFWSHCIPDHTVRRFLCESYVSLYDKTKVRKNPLANKVRKIENGQPSCCNLCPCERKGLEGLCYEESGYFSKDWLGGNCPSDAEMESLTDKMIIISDTMRNLSVDKENAAFLAKNATFLRYLLLNLNCSVTYLKTAAYEIFNNISPFMNVAEPEKHLITHQFISLVSRGVHSKNALIQMKSFISLGGWYTIRENQALKRAAQKNYSSLHKFEDLNLSSVSPALNKYIMEKDIISVDLILQFLVNISSHGKRGCDDLCNKAEDVVKTIVAICTPDLKYDWETLQIFLRLKHFNPYHTDGSLPASSKKTIKSPKLISQAIQITVPTDYCIVDTSAPGSCPQIVDFIANVEEKFGNIPEGYAKFQKNQKFLPADEECFGMSFEKFEETLRIKACGLLKHIAKVSAIGRKMILQYDTRLILQSIKGSKSIPEKIIVEILQTLGSKYAKLERNRSSVNE